MADDTNRPTSEESGDGTLAPGDDPPSVLYDFYKRALWQQRFKSIDEALDLMALSLIEVLKTTAGMTVEGWVKAALGEAAGAQLLNEAQPAGLSDTGGVKVVARLKKEATEPLWFARLLIAHLVESKLIPLEQATDNNFLDANFEAKQFLNLYSFWVSLYSFAHNVLKRSIEAMADQHERGNSPPRVSDLRECFRHVAQDIEIVQRAILQRGRFTNYTLGTGTARATHGLMGPESLAWHVRYEMSAQARALLVTDKLASKALAPVQGLLPSGLPREPITYLSPTTHIRNVPYSRLLLVGIRYDCVAPLTTEVGSSDGSLAPLSANPYAFDLMAIPHEVGHYVYNHASWEVTQPPSPAASGGASTGAERDSFPKLVAQLTGQPASSAAPYKAWGEELFADLYACVIAGPLAVLGMQNLLALIDPTVLEKDDGEHPTALVRPFLLSQMLRVLGDIKPSHYAFRRAAAALDDNWAKILEEHGYRVHRHAGSIAELRKAPLGAASPPTTAELVTGGDVAALRRALDPLMRGLATPLLEKIELDAWGEAANQLSATLPWGRRDSSDLTTYDAALNGLTNSTFARTPMPKQRLNDVERSEGQTVAASLAGWGRRGPFTIGGH